MTEKTSCASPTANAGCDGDDRADGKSPSAVDARTSHGFEVESGADHVSMRIRMIALLRKVHIFITEGQRSMLDEEVIPLVQDLTDEAGGLARELELAAAMETALTDLSECGWLDRDVREIPSVAAVKAKAREVVDDILLLRLTSD